MNRKIGTLLGLMIVALIGLRTAADGAHPLDSPVSPLPTPTYTPTPTPTPTPYAALVPFLPNIVDGTE